MARTISSPARRIGPILLVDDYDDARLTVREALENAGYSVIEAENGQAALSLLVSRPQPVSLIVLDLQMPVMDGWRLLELLRCYVGLAKIPVIIVTAHEPRLEGQQHAGIFGCMHAPYQLQDLVNMVDDCMTGVRRPAAEQERAQGKG
jgi:CheY-like chemotaxis protein